MYDRSAGEWGCQISSGSALIIRYFEGNYKNDSAITRVLFAGRGDLIDGFYVIKSG